MFHAGNSEKTSSRAKRARSQRSFSICGGREGGREGGSTAVERGREGGHKMANFFWVEFQVKKKIDVQSRLPTRMICLALHVCGYP